MNAGHSLASRLREVFIDGTFVAYTNYSKILEDVSWQESEHIVRNLNTIAALTFHINYYLNGLNNVFEGGELNIRDKFSFDCESINSEKEWKERKDTLIKNAQVFIKHVDNFSLEQLEAPFVMEQYGTCQRNINAVIEHSYYHLGQISLIKKMIRKKTNP